MSDRPESLREALPRLDRIFRRFLPQLRKQRGLVAASVTALFVTTFLKLLEPWPLKIVIDTVLHSSAHRAARWSFIPGLDSFKPINVIIGGAIAVVVITALRAATEYLNTVGFALIGNRVLREVRDMLYRHLQRLPLSFHTSARTGDLTIRVIGDVNMLRDDSVT